MRRLPVLLAALLAGVLMVPASAVANVGGRPAPRVWDVVPAPGEIVPVGTVEVGATAVSESGVSDVRLFVDGVQTPSDIVDTSDVSQRLEAVIDLTEGRHQIDIVFTPNGSGDVQRTWFVSASEIGSARLAGKDRLATSSMIARNGRESGVAPAAVLARSDQFADALAGAPLAFALEGPLLLTSSTELSPETADALTELLAEDAEVVLLGGEVALSAAVATGVEDLGFTTRRVAGESRYDTAGQIADLLPDSDDAIVASGTTFPDALAVATPAAIAGVPILLTAPESLSDAAADRIEDRNVTIVGGPVAVSDDTENSITSIAATSRRIGGETRYDTAAAIVRAYPTEEPSTTLALASGVNFADALAGAVNAAVAGLPLMLTAGDRPTPATSQIVRDLGITGLRVYGGPVAISEGAVQVLRAAPFDDGPALTSMAPASGTEVNSLDTITLSFADEVDVARSDIAIFFDGRELDRGIAQGDFADTVVLTPAPLPVQPQRGVAIPVRIVGEILTGDAIRHVDTEFTYRKIALTRGDSGDDVLALQQRLSELGYWLGAADGGYGTLTTQAVMAFQKVEGLPTTGVAGSVTQERLEVAGRPSPASDSGNLLEIDKTRQVIFIVRGGNVLWTINTSTGTEKPYTYEGTQYIADTPVGRFRISREIDGVREGNLGSLFRPKYFHPDGIAIHGSPSIPNFPASHGCARMTDPAINFIWDNDLAPIGSTILVYGRFPGT